MILTFYLVSKLSSGTILCRLMIREHQCPGGSAKLKIHIYLIVGFTRRIRFLLLGNNSNCLSGID